MSGHPIRNAPVHVFERRDVQEGGYRWIAMLYPYRSYPMHFHGPTQEAVLQSVADFKADAIEKHEAKIIARQNALEKARAAKAKKAGAA